MRWVPCGWRVAGLASAVLVGAGCSRAAQPERGLERLRADVASLQVERERMAERLSILEMNEQLRVQAEQKLPSATFASRELRPRLPVVRIGAGGESSAGSPGDGGQPRDLTLDAADSEDARPVVSNGGYAAARPRRSPDPRAPRVDVIPSSPEANRAFEAAVALVRAKRYDAALDALTAFLVRYPDHPGTDRAMYWRGECLYAQGDVGRAAEQFQGILARFPFGNKAPDALLKLGICQRRLGATAQAERTFADLKERFPNSDAARQLPRL